MQEIITTDLRSVKLQLKDPYCAIYAHACKKFHSTCSISGKREVTAHYECIKDFNLCRSILYTCMYQSVRVSTESSMFLK